jgi:Amidase
VTSQSSDGVSKGVPVPSRHYYKVSAEKPLAGARVSLKDIFDVQGIKTTLSSKAWSELYSAANTSAPYVKHLLDLGAVIVGKTKTTQFATAMEWVDFQSPINPRGDRYQEPSGSSTGAAASQAGYDWLDYAIGGDCKSYEQIALRTVEALIKKQLEGASESPQPIKGYFRYDLHLDRHL